MKSSNLSRILTEEVQAREVRARQGKVISIQAGPPRTLTVEIDGTNFSNIRVANHVEPTVNEGVWILDTTSGSMLAVATNSSGQTRSGFLKSNGDTTLGGAYIFASSGHVSDAMIVIPASTHVTSERAGLILGDWQIGQDGSANGTKDFYLWDGNEFILKAYQDNTIDIGINGTTRVRRTLQACQDSGHDAIFNINSESGSTINMEAFNVGNTVKRNINIAKYGGSVTIGTPIDYSYLFSLGGTYSIRTTGINRFDGATYCYGILATQQNQIFAEKDQDGGNASDHTWNLQQLRINQPSASGSAQQAGMSFWVNANGVAPILRCYGAFGERIDAVNNPNTGYISLNASAFTVQSSMRIKEQIEDVEDTLLLDKVKQTQAVHFRPKVRPQTLRNSARFDEVNAKWIAKGREPLRVTPDHMASHDHDCTVDSCLGTSDVPCPIAANDTHRFGLIAEQLFEIAPEVVSLDEQGLPAAYDVDQVAALALGAVGALTRKLDAALERIVTLESQVAALQAAGG